MQTSLLDYSYPQELIATEPRRDYRILQGVSAPGQQPSELNLEELFSLFSPGDVLVVNETSVVKRRVFAGDLEILFIAPLGTGGWKVLLPARDLKVGDEITLPAGVRAILTEKGLPQTLQLSQELTDKYFAQYGEFALPPYIQKARGERHSKSEDEKWYQTAWANAEKSGSCAAPTASLHFSATDLKKLQLRGVAVKKLTLHVGIGTFLPVKADNLNDHKMHSEYIEIPVETTGALERARTSGKKVWALGTTTARAIEFYGNTGRAVGHCDLFIKPGYEWQFVSGLLTNFHQPKSTLLALVAAFAGLENVLASYAYAVENRFRLFSYGDLSVWMR